MFRSNDTLTGGQPTSTGPAVPVQFDSVLHQAGTADGLPRVVVNRQMDEATTPPIVHLSSPPESREVIQGLGKGGDRSEEVLMAATDVQAEPPPGAAGRVLAITPDLRIWTFSTPAERERWLNATKVGPSCSDQFFAQVHSQLASHHMPGPLEDRASQFVRLHQLFHATGFFQLPALGYPGWLLREFVRTADLVPQSPLFLFQQLYQRARLDLMEPPYHPLIRFGESRVARPGDRPGDISHLLPALLRV